MTAWLTQTLQSLEWNRFLELSEKEARCLPARSRLKELAEPVNWAQGIDRARLSQQETQEMHPLLDREALWGPLEGLLDPTLVLDRLKRGSVLEVPDLANLRRWLYAVDSWIQVPRNEIQGELFKRALGLLPDPLEPLRFLETVLTPEGELSEKASPRLASLYNEIRLLKRDISVMLDQLLKVYSQRGIIQENFSDIRDGRYVIPVKISAQGEVDGNIYEASVSRQTVFVEPKEVASLNNRLRQRQNELIQETFAVLEDVCGKLRPFSEEIEKAVAILVYWDTAQARARFGRYYSGKAIEVREERSFFLRQTAHPLLWWSVSPQSIIRNEIDFGGDARAFLLTGPNTGGKTVLLKTLGLAGICARTGFPFPATDHPVVPFFDHFFADLGDPQSLEKHLSSFSGHVLRFKLILENLTERSLVLIDELNSATDPEEGAALGRAVLETIIARGAMTVTTTHDPYLKAIASKDSRVMNGSMEFDETSRSPTYRMIIGVPGRSRAIETAERLGIPREVLELARQYLSKGHLEFESILSQMQADAQEVARARKEAIAFREEADRIKRDWIEKTRASVSEMLERTRQKLRRILEQAQDEVRSTVRKLDEARSRREVDVTRGNVNDVFSRAVERLDSALEEEAPELADVLGEKPEASSSAASIEVGMDVRIPKWKTVGRVLEISGNRVKVAMGTIQVGLSLDEIEPAPKPAPGEQKSMWLVQSQKKREKTVALDVPEPPSPTLDLRGMRLDDAMRELEKYLDLAFRSGGLTEVTIIHGLGTGALREGTRKLFKSLPYVKTFRDGGAGHGGMGATLVEFDR